MAVLMRLNKGIILAAVCVNIFGYMGGRILPGYLTGVCEHLHLLLWEPVNWNYRVAVNL